MGVRANPLEPPPRGPDMRSVLSQQYSVRYPVCLCNRSGLLSGACKEEYSLVLGTSCLAHSFCTDGGSTGLFNPYLQADSS